MKFGFNWQVWRFGRVRRCALQPSHLSLISRPGMGYRSHVCKISYPDQLSLLPSADGKVRCELQQGRQFAPGIYFACPSLCMSSTASPVRISNS